MRVNISGLNMHFSITKIIFTICVLLGCGLFIYLFSGVCFPFIVGFILAYLCEPIVSSCEKYISRTLFSLFLALCSVCLFILIGYKILPYIKDYIEILVTEAPACYDKFMDFLNNSLSSTSLESYQPEIAKIKSEIQRYLDQKAYIVVSVIKNVVLKRDSITSFFSFFVIMPISFFYFLKDWNSFVDSVYKCIPNRQKKLLTEIFSIVRDSFLKFFHGQFYVVIFLSLYYSVLLRWVGVPGWIGLGCISGLFSFIPFIGALFSFAFVLFVSVPVLTLMKVYAIFSIYLIGQFVEGYVLSPKFVGRKTGLHPLWILFSFFAGIQLLGVLGVLIAIPLTAVIRNLMKFFVDKFVATQSYKQ